MELNRREIAGIRFEAVRFVWPLPHWRPKIVETGYIYPAGIFSGESRPRMWESMEDTARVTGPERFAREARNLR